MTTKIDRQDSRPSDEKLDISHIEYPDEEKVIRSYADTDEPKLHMDHGFDQSFIKKTTRKIDWRLIPPLIAMYCISSIDRKNVSLARAANHEAMQTELSLGKDKYNIITLLFVRAANMVEKEADPEIVPNVHHLRASGEHLRSVAEQRTEATALTRQSQLGLRKIGPRIWLSTAVLLWGSECACGEVPNLVLSERTDADGQLSLSAWVCPDLRKIPQRLTDRLFEQLAGYGSPEGAARCLRELPVPWCGLPHRVLVPSQADGPSQRSLLHHFYRRRR